MLLDLLTGGGPRADISSAQELMEEMLRGRSTQAGVNVNHETAMRATAVYASVRVLAEGVAQLPLILYRRRADGGKDRAVSNPLSRVFQQMPNTWQTSFEFREMMVGHLALRGNFYAWKNMVDRGTRVRELIPLHPDRMEVEQQADSSLIYRYTFDSGDRREIPQGEIFHVRGLSFDGVVGIDPISYQRESIGHYLAAERHGANFFGNGAHPSGALKHPQKLSDTAHRNLEESFQRNYGGTESGRPMVLEEGMEWQQLSISNENSQFLETYKHKRTEIASMFRVPPHMIGDMERATFSNIEQQSLDFVIYTLLPWLKRIEQAIQRDLIPESSRNELFAEHLVEGLLRGDSSARQEFYVAMLEHGVFSPNEVREKENLNPRDNGDAYYFPANMSRSDGEEGNDGEVSTPEE